MDALQHITSKQSHIGQKEGHSTQDPHSTLSIAGGMTTNATMRSERNRETRKQLEVQRREWWANTKAMSNTFPQTVMRMITVNMKANSHGPLPVMFQVLLAAELLL